MSTFAWKPALSLVCSTSRKASFPRTAPEKAHQRALATACSRDPHSLLHGLYAQYAPTLRAYVTGILQDPHQAEDVVQETMVRAWRNAEALVPARGSVRGWLTRVAHNIAVDRIRARNARPAEVGEAAATAPQTLDDHASAVVDSVFVARALARLSPDHREILLVVYFADRTAAQAAELLGLPVGTVKSRTYHALRRLRVYLEEEMNGASQ